MDRQEAIASTISLFKIETEMRISELMSYAREELAMERSEFDGDDTSHGWHYERATALRGQADGLREAIKMIDSILLLQEQVRPQDQFPF